MRFVTVAVVSAVLWLAFAGAADAALVPQRSMKGVQLGWTKAQVRAELGRPARFIVRRNEITGKDLSYRYGLTEITFVGGSNRVGVISTTSRKERTSRGVGVGSTAATVAARVPGARCRREFGLRHCWVGVFRAGRTVTDFRIGRSGRVTRIVLGRVID